MSTNTVKQSVHYGFLILKMIIFIAVYFRSYPFLMSTYTVKHIVHYGFETGKMIIFIVVYFSVHILVKTIIPSELCCCNMILFC